jgi:hypothetical protein
MASIACSNIGIMTKGTLVFMKVGDDNGKPRVNAVFNGIGMAITDIVAKEREGMSCTIGSGNVVNSCWFPWARLDSRIVFSNRPSTDSVRIGDWRCVC